MAFYRAEGVSGGGNGHQQVNEQSLYNRISEIRPWRWIIGRVSCGLRIPVYLLTSVLQTLKMGAKFFVSCITFNQLRRFECTRSWTFQGLAKDGIANLSLLQHTINSIWCVIWAPPKNYNSFCDSLKVCGKTLWGSYHKVEETRDQNEIGRVWFAFKVRVPNYLKQIIQSDCIMSEYSKEWTRNLALDHRQQEAIENKLRTHVKAG